MHCTTAASLEMSDEPFSLPLNQLFLYLDSKLIARDLFHEFCQISQGHVDGIKTDARFFAFYVLGSNSPVSDFSMEIYKNIMRVTKMLTEKFIFIFIFIWSVLRRRMIQEV